MCTTWHNPQRHPNAPLALKSQVWQGSRLCLWTHLAWPERQLWPMAYKTSQRIRMLLPSPGTGRWVVLSLLVSALLPRFVLDFIHTSPSMSTCRTDI